MSVRKILSARSAAPEVERRLDALVHAAVFIGSADGRFGVEELDVFIDTMREVISSALGDELVQKWGATSQLLDRARAARAQLRTKGPEPFLKDLAPNFSGLFARDGLILAYRIVLADEQVTEKEAAAFEALSRAVGVEVAEVQLLKELAGHREAASKLGHRGASIEAVQKLTGWSVTLRKSPEEVDVRAEFAQRSGGRLALELEAAESALRLFVTDAQGRGPQVLFVFAEQLSGLLAAIDAQRETLTPSTLPAALASLKKQCAVAFVEHEGRLARV